MVTWKSRKNATIPQQSRVLIVEVKKQDYPNCTYVRMPVGLLLCDVITTEFIRYSFIFFVAVVTVSDGEHVGTLYKNPGSQISQQSQQKKPVISLHQQPATLLCGWVSHQKMAIMFLTYFEPSDTINDPKVGLNIRSRRVSMKLDLSGPTKQPYI